MLRICWVEDDSDRVHSPLVRVRSILCSALEFYYTYTHIIGYMYTCKNREFQLIKEQKYFAIALSILDIRITLPLTLFRVFLSVSFILLLVSLSFLLFLLFLLLLFPVSHNFLFSAPSTNNYLRYL